MNKISLYCLILFIFPAYSQIQTPAIKNDAITYISLQKYPAEFIAGIKNSSITVLDARDDTSNIGYSNERLVKQYQFRRGFINEVKSWFSTYLGISPENKNGNSLLINIKKLRISDEAVTTILDNGKSGLPKNGWEKGVIVKIEYYLEKDSFFTPLYRFDSIIPLKGRLKKNGDEYISIAFKTSLERFLTFKNDSVFLSRNKILLKDIERVNQLKYDLPVYSTTDHKKGVYKNFHDFKMNIISWTDFEFRKGEMGDIIYVKETDIEYPLRNAWGFSDGKNFYINSGDKYSKLIQAGNTYYFKGIKSLRKITRDKINWVDGLEVALDRTSGMPATTPSHLVNTVYDVDLKYYQLDMENGNVY